MSITIYSTTTCPYCKMLKSWLKEKGIDYQDKMIDQDAAAMEEMTKVSDGHMGVPFSVITKDSGEIVKIAGFDKAKFQALLGIS